MSYRYVVNTLAALEAAIRDDELARAEAMQSGLDASLPLKPRTIVQLCSLGERMLEADRRLQRARLDVDLTLPLGSPTPTLGRELSTAAGGACDEPTAAVGNSGKG